MKFLHNKTALSALAAVGILALSQGAQAQSIGIGASIGGANCVLSTGAGITFGTYNPVAATAVLGSSTVSLTCTTGAVPIVAVSNGANFSAGSRRMLSGADALNYDVLTPTANTPLAACPAVAAGTAWPAAPGFTLTAAPTTATRVYNICARLPAGQNSPTGTYNDNITVSVSF